MAGVTHEAQLGTAGGIHPTALICVHPNQVNGQLEVTALDEFDDVGNLNVGRKILWYS
jgi:hypothetical protein